MRGKLSGQKPYFDPKKDPIVKRGVSQRRSESGLRAETLGVYRFKKKSKKSSQNA
jgi:hypothetical protein